MKRTVSMLLVLCFVLTLLPLPASALTFLDPPKNLKASNLTATSLTLSWTASPGALSYTIYTTCKGVSAHWHELAVTKATSYSATGLNPNELYFFHVKANDTNGTSSNSNQISVATKPNTPPWLHSTNITASSVRLDWGVPSGGASRYYIYRDGVQIASGPGTSCTDAGLKANTTYTYTVCAGNVDGLKSGNISKTVQTLPNSSSTAPVPVPDPVVPITVAFPTAQEWFSKGHKQRVWPADVNGDGKKDLMGIDFWGGIHYTLSNGDGTYSALQSGSVIGFTNAGQWFETGTRDRLWPADVNGDGKADWVGVAYSGEIIVMLNQGNGVFSAAIGSSDAFRTAESWFYTGYKQRVWPADVNGDGKTDLMGIDYSGRILYVLSNGNGTFSALQAGTMSEYKNAGQWFDISTRDRVWPADINGDGKADLVGVAYSGAIVVMLNQGNGAFSAVIVSSNAFRTDENWFHTSYKQRVWPADVNGDGKTDLMGIDYSGRILYVLSIGDGTFSALQAGDVSGFSNAAQWFETGTRDRVWPADANGDGKADVVGVTFDGTIGYVVNQVAAAAPLPSPTLTLKYHTWNVPTANQSQDPTPNIVTTTNTTWTATVSASWIHASPLSGNAGSTTMNIWVDANPTAVARSGYVEFKTASGLVDRYVINQVAGTPAPSPTLTLKYHTWNVPTANQSQDPTPNIVTTTNTTWTATVSASWIHASPLSGNEGSTTMNIWVEANPTAVARSGHIEFRTASGLMDRYVINQVAGAPATGALTNGTYTIQNKYSGKNVDACSNATLNGPVKQFAKDGSSEQKFELKYYAALDAYEIISHRSASYPNLWMTVSGSKAILQTTKSYFKIVKNTDGTFRIVPTTNTGLALKAPSTASGIQFEFATYISGATSQHFTFTKV